MALVSFASSVCVQPLDVLVDEEERYFHWVAENFTGAPGPSATVRALWIDDNGVQHGDPAAVMETFPRDEELIQQDFRELDLLCVLLRAESEPGLQ